MRAAIRHHNDPLNLAGAEDANGTHSGNSSKRNSVSYIVAAGLKLTETEIDLLIAFLASLEDNLAVYMPDIVPARVPSGLPVAAMFNRE